MDFFDQQKRARRQTRLLVCLFVVAVLFAIVSNYLILGTIVQALRKPAPHTTHFYNIFATAFLLLGELLLDPVHFFKWLWDPQLACWIALGTLVFIALGSLYKTLLLRSGGAAVAKLLDGRCVESNTSDPDEQRLRHVVEEMAVASQTPVPEIYVLDRERGINTFAAGHSQDDVAIGVTFGCLKLLDRDELQAVVAHEFSHILNGDTRLNLRLMALVHGLLWPTIVGRILLRGTTQAPEPGESIFDKQESALFLPFAPPALLFLFLGGVGVPLTRLIKSAICREREWLADAAAVQFTRNPAGLEGAFKKIGGLLKQGRMDTPFAETASHLYFVNSAHQPWFIFFSTHPPLNKRILALDPKFDGAFQHIRSLPSTDAKYDLVYEESVRRARAEAARTDEDS